jgi:hypothetical protein
VGTETTMSATIIEFPRTTRQALAERDGKSYRALKPAEAELPPVSIEMLREFIINSAPPSPEQLRRETFLLECD